LLSGKTQTMLRECRERKLSRDELPVDFSTVFDYPKNQLLSCLEASDCFHPIFALVSQTGMNEYFVIYLPIIAATL